MEKTKQSTQDTFLSLFKPLSEFAEESTDYFIPWRLDMLYTIEPNLKTIADSAVSYKRKRFYIRIEAYNMAKREADHLLGWNARDPRLRCSDAWDCLFNYILAELRL